MIAIITIAKWECCANRVSKLSQTEFDWSSANR